MSSRLPSAVAAVAIGMALSCSGTKSEVVPEKPIQQAAKRAEQPATPDADFRAHKPEPLQRKMAFELPVPIERKLKNGVPLLVVENHQVPLVAMEVLIRNGQDAEPEGKGGLSKFVAATLTEGTKHRTSLQVAQDLESLAAELHPSAALETSRVHLNCLSETLPAALQILADVIANPVFKADDVERVRRILLTDLQQKKANASRMAQDEANLLIFGERHPWGRPVGGVSETVKSITPADLKRFHDRWYVPNNAIIAVSGDVTPERAVELLEKALAGWKPKKLPPLSLPAMPASTSRTVTVVDKPGVSQSQVWVVGRGVPAKHPDAVPLRVANNILGGLFGSRLNLNLREAKGYSYGVRSALEFMRNTGVITAYGGIQAPNTSDAVVEYENELKRFQSGEITDQELSQAKEAISRGLPSQLETNDAVSRQIATNAFVGLPRDYLKNLPQAVARVQKADVARVAASFIRPDEWPVIVVGPKAMSEAKLRELGLGPVEVKSLDRLVVGENSKPAGSKTAPRH